MSFLRHLEVRQVSKLSLQFMTLQTEHHLQCQCSLLVREEVELSWDQYRASVCLCLSMLQGQKKAFPSFITVSFSFIHHIIHNFIVSNFILFSFCLENHANSRCRKVWNSVYYYNVLYNKTQFEILKQTLWSPLRCSDLEELLSQLNKKGKMFVKIYQSGMIFVRL